MWPSLQVVNYLRFGCTPVGVLDGEAPEAKLPTLQARWGCLARLCHANKAVEGTWPWRVRCLDSMSVHVQWESSGKV